MEGNVVVADGGVLTVNGDITISEGSNINVEQGELALSWGVV